MHTSSLAHISCLKRTYYHIDRYKNIAETKHITVSPKRSYYMYRYVCTCTYVEKLEHVLPSIIFNSMADVIKHLIRSTCGAI